MEKVAGGKMFNKIVSSFLVAALMGAGGSSVSFAESSKITEKQSIKVSSKKAKTVETIFKTIKDNKGKATFSAVLASILVLIGVNQVGTKKEIIENVEPDLWFEKLGGTKEDIDKYVKNPNEYNPKKYRCFRCTQDNYIIEKDDPNNCQMLNLWFEKFGGTKEDIDKYVCHLKKQSSDPCDKHYNYEKNYMKKKCDEHNYGQIVKASIELKKISNALHQIDVDVNRTSIASGNVEIAKINEEKILPRILKIVELEGQKEMSYEQGFADVAGMIILKFFGHDNAKSYSDLKLKEEEAKIFYVYKKIIKVLSTLHLKLGEQRLFHDYENAFIYDNPLIIGFLVCSIKTGFTRYLKQPYLMKFWDSVIINSNNCCKTMDKIIFAFLKNCFQKLKEIIGDELDNFGHSEIISQFFEEMNDDTFNRLLNKALN